MSYANLAKHSNQKNWKVLSYQDNIVSNKTNKQASKKTSRKALKQKRDRGQKNFLDSL